VNATIDQRADRLIPRLDLEFIASAVSERAKVLDLGCGDGTLLKMLQERKHIIGRGVEISNEGVRDCISKGLSVYHGNLDEGLNDYPDNSFDYVILSQTLQAVLKPELVFREMFRIGRVGIVSFPNFGYWLIRWQLLRSGKMPKSDYLPFEWYDTPNIHLMTIKDFNDFCTSHGLRVLKANYLSDGKVIHFMPNLRAKVGIFVVGKK
jgi:methionine biosynthesis protein MetW